MGIQQILPETGETFIELPAQAVGALRFACGMGMYRGTIDFVAQSAFANEPVGAAPVNQAVILPVPADGVVTALSPPVDPTPDCDPNVTSCIPAGAMLRIVPVVTVAPIDPVGIAPATGIDAAREAAAQTEVVTDTGTLLRIAPLAAPAAANSQTIRIKVTDQGYQPAVTQAKANLPSKLVLRTEGTYG